MIGFIDSSDQRRSWTRFYRSPGEAHADARDLLKREFGADDFKLLEVKRIDCKTDGCDKPPQLGATHYCAACNSAADDQERQRRRRGTRLYGPPSVEAEEDLERHAARYDEDDWREDR